jgi:RNA polymerase sigma factor (sigma-70 family)
MTEPELLALLQEYLTAAPGRASLDQTKAWDEFYHEYDPLIARIARKCPRRWWDSEDLRQEIWKALGKSLRTLKLDPSRGTLQRWLLGVAGCVRCRQTQRRRADWEHDSALPEDIVDPATIGSNQTARQSLADRVRAAIALFAARSSPRDARVVAMHWVEERTVPQIAGMMGLSVKCVESILHRAKPKLRRLLTLERADRS